MILKKTDLIFLLVVFTALEVSCTKQKIQTADYLNYIENKSNGLKVSKNIGEIDYTVQYKPLEYILLKENKNEDQQKRKEDLQGMQYYTLSYSLVNSRKDILKAGLNAKEDYYERVNYFSFGLQNDIYLVDGRDTMDCKLFNYVRSYGLSPKADFIMAFETNKDQTPHDKLIVIEDKIYGGGIIKLKIEKDDINNVPELINNQL